MVPAAALVLFQPRIPMGTEKAERPHAVGADCASVEGRRLLLTVSPKKDKPFARRNRLRVLCQRGGAPAISRAPKALNAALGCDLTGRSICLAVF
jgi:hypothetical protein